MNKSKSHHKIANSSPNEHSVLVSIISTRTTHIVFSLIYSTSLVYIYSEEIVLYWGYLGFYWDPQFEKICIAFLLIMQISIFTPLSNGTRSSFILLITYMHTIPSLLYFGIANKEYYYFFTVLLATGIFIALAHVPTNRIVGSRLTWKNIYWISGAISFLTLILIIIFSGLQNFNLNFEAIYEYRSNTREQLPAFLGYLRPITTKVFLPLFLILCFSRKRVLPILVGIALVFAFFAYSNHKSIIASTLVTIVLFFALRNTISILGISKLFAILLIACAIEVFFALQIFETESASRLSSLVVRRTLFVPPLLDSLHMDFFSTSPFTYWSQSRIGLGIVDRVYEINTPFIIGESYFGRSTLAANTGFIGAGYSNAGIAGVMSYAALLGLIVSLLHQYGKTLGHSLVVGLSFSQVVGAVTSADLPSVVLTHGLAVLLVLLAFMPKRGL